MSHAQIAAPSGRPKTARESVSTAVGIAAERIAMANRERRVTDARKAARLLDRRPTLANVRN